MAGHDLTWTNSQPSVASSNIPVSLWLSSNFFTIYMVDSYSTPCAKKDLVHDCKSYDTTKTYFSASTFSLLTTFIMLTGWIFSSVFFLVLRSLLAKLRTSIPARSLYHGFQSTGPTSPFSYFSSVSPPEQNKPLDITFYDLGNINYLWLFYGVRGR